MTFEEISTMIESIGLDYAFDHFPPEKKPALPFIVFNIDKDYEYADGRNYQPIGIIDIELVTEDKDFTTEALVESKITGAGLTFQYDGTAYNDAENVYQTSWAVYAILS